MYIKACVEEEGANGERGSVEEGVSRGRSVEESPSRGGSVEEGVSRGAAWRRVLAGGQRGGRC